MLPLLAGLSLRESDGDTGVDPGKKRAAPEKSVQRMLEERRQKLDRQKKLDEKRRAEDAAELARQKKLEEKRRAEDAAESERKRVSNAKATFEEFLPALLTPIGPDQVFELFKTEFERAYANIDQEKYINMSWDEALAAIRPETVPNSEDYLWRSAEAWESIVRPELKRIQDAAKLYIETKKNPPPGFERMTREEKDRIQQRYNRLKALVEPTPLRYNGRMPELDPPLSLKVTIARNGIELKSMDRNTFTVSDQAFAHWIKQEIAGRRNVDHQRKMGLRPDVAEGAFPMAWPLIIYHFGVMSTHASRIELYCKGLALAMAAKRANEILLTRRLALDDPTNPPIVVGGVSLVGWHLPLPLTAAPTGFERFLSAIQGSSRRLESLCKRILNGRPSRQLGAILLREQDASAPAIEERGEEAEEEEEDDEPLLKPDADTSVTELCIKFEEGGQTCDEMNELMKPIAKFKRDFPEHASAFRVFPHLISLVRGREDQQRLQEFRDGQDVAAIVSWASHARVLFKLSEDQANRVAIVDPWRPARRVKIPPLIQKVFETKRVLWVQRPSEQCKENSCTYIALARALVIAANYPVEPNVEAVLAASKSDIRTGYGPYMVAVVKLLTYARNQEKLLPSPERIGVP